MSVISGVSVAHDTASVEAIEVASAPDEAKQVRRLNHQYPVKEAFVLQTCNRVEVYVVTHDPETGRRVLAETLSDVPDDVVRLNHEESLRHLIRVACGLESLVLGEDQILGQVRDAYERARDAGAIGPMLEQAVTKALHVGERVRDETAINEGTVSIATAAVELADREHGIEGAVTLVIGAGEMGSKTARLFAVKPVEEVIVANRTVRRAERLAEEFDVTSRAVRLDDLPSAAIDADVLVSATGSEDPIVDREMLVDGNATYVVDIAQPRDVAPAATDLPEVTHRNMDSLESITERTKEQRREAADDVRTIVDEEFDRLLEQYKRQRADDVIAAMYESAEAVKRRELDTAVCKLESRGYAPDELREVIESLADALVNQLLAAPTESLRKAAVEDDWTTIDTALRLFDPEAGTAGVPPDEDGASDSPRATTGTGRRDRLSNWNSRPCESAKARVCGVDLSKEANDDD